jgi:hypothetical protein
VRSRLLVRSLVVPSLVILSLAVGASSAFGVIAHLGNGTSVSYQPAPGNGSPARARSFDAFFTNLDYSGGPVMPSNTNYTLYWRPKTATAYPAGFKTGVNTYFKDLEHDSGGHENVDSVASQYNDAAGEFAQYKSKFGGELIDEDPYPPNGCTRAPICLTDAQIRAELVKFVSENSLPTDLEHEYFLLAPEGVESCFEESFEAQCSANAEAGHQAYCAYHSGIPVETGLIVYSNDPFVNGKNCDEPHHINGPSDSALFGGMSHEHNESITDPEPNNAWTDWGAFTGEDGDKCRTFVESSEFGTPLGEVEVEGKKLTYNQEINGHKYWYQQEWSNKGFTCLQRLQFETSEAPAATFTSAVVSGDELKFDVTGSTTGANVRYVWQFNDFAGHQQNQTIETEGPTIAHLFPETGTYTVALTVMLSGGTSDGTAKQVFVGQKLQTSAFTSSPPPAATVGGLTYLVEASATSGVAVALAIDPSSSSVCSISGATVSFIGAGTCTIDANQAGNAEYKAAPQVQQSFAVSKKSQTSAFTSSPPPAATVGSTYTVAAVASSGLPVLLSSTLPSVCSISGATVSFIAVGTCTIDADQAGNANYMAALQAQQSFVVSPVHTLIIEPKPPILIPTPNSNFSALATAFDQRTGAITFVEAVGDPGTFSWLITFQNGKFGAFAANKRKCKVGQVRLGGRCRPAAIVFGEGSQTVAAPGTVTFTVKPSASGLKALRNALKRKKGLPVSATFTFQSSHGGGSISHTQSLDVRLKKSK